MENTKNISLADVKNAIEIWAKKNLDPQSNINMDELIQSLEPANNKVLQDIESWSKSNDQLLK